MCSNTWNVERACDGTSTSFTRSQPSVAHKTHLGAMLSPVGVGIIQVGPVPGSAVHPLTTYLPAYQSTHPYIQGLPTTMPYVHTAKHGPKNAHLGDMLGPVGVGVIEVGPVPGSAVHPAGGPCQVIPVAAAVVERHHAPPENFIRRWTVGLDGLAQDRTRVLGLKSSRLISFKVNQLHKYIPQSD
jgi:hypothetical protein